MSPKNIRRVFSVEPSRHSVGNRCDPENPRNPRVTNNKVSLFLTRAQTLSADELKVVDTFTRNSRSLSVLVHNARSTRGFVVKAKPQRKSRRCACDCYAFGILLYAMTAAATATKSAAKAISP